MAAEMGLSVAAKDLALRQPEHVCVEGGAV
jgi:hypothetical protein